MQLTGRNTLMGEYNVQIRVIIMKNRTPSETNFMLLLPVFLCRILIGTYLTLIPLLNTPRVMVAG
jgi:hypothetical protein